MGFDDRLWIYLVEEHEAHLAVPAPPRPKRLERHKRHKRLKRPALRPRLAAGVVLLAAAIAGVLVLTQPSGESAWATQVIERAAAVVIAPSSPHTILHIAGTESLSPLARRDMATTVSTLSEEAWIQQGPPWGERALARVPGGPLLESSSSGDVYDATTDVLYPARQAPSGRPHYTLAPTGHDGSYTMRVDMPHGGVFTQTLDAGTVRALRDGSQDVQWSVAWNGHTEQVAPLIGPSAKAMRTLQSQQPSPASTSFASQLRALLRTGHARVTRTTTADGRPAIEIASVHPQSGPQTDYYVDPNTYAPIELDTFGFDNPKDVTRLRLTVYHELPLAGHRRLLRLAVPATARVDRTAAGYWNAAGLPTPF